ncbi:MAG: TonB-dependent receptor [Bacteroidales bacterium]|nr:TonB-dependent receptor [Bacteroidales bacterium]
MKRIFLISSGLALCSALLAATHGPDPADRGDTLRTSVVTGTRVSMLRDQVPAPISVVGRQTLGQSDENVLMPSLMEQVPGLFVTSRGVTGYGVSGGAAGAISLRGFGAGNGRVAILIDGHPQFESIYGHPVADEYFAANAARVEVSRGAASVLYGSNAMGGAINIITRQPVRDGNELGVKLMGGSYGTWRGHVSEAYRHGRFTLLTTLSADRTAGHRDNSAFRSLGGMFNAGYQINDVWKASARLSLSDAYSENPGTVAEPMFDGTARTTRSMAGVSLDNRTGRSSGTIDLFYNWGDHLINDGHTADKAPQEYLFHGTDFTAGLTAYQTFGLWEGNDLTAGLDYLYYGGHAFRNPVTEVYANHRHLNEEALYLLDKQAFGPFLVSAGLRLDRHSAYGVEWIPQLGASWTPATGTTVKLSASKGFRMPNMRELYMYAVANEALLPEKAWSYDLTVGQHLLDGRLNLEASAFHTRGSNIIEVNVVDGIRQNRNVGAFANTGAEFAADWRIARPLLLNANYSYLHMDTIYTGAPVHKAWLGARWTPGRWSVDLGAMGIAGLYLTTGENARTADYIDLKLRVAFRIRDGFELFVRGTNLLNRQYETMDGFPEPGIVALGGLSWSVASK